MKKLLFAVAFLFAMSNINAEKYLDFYQTTDGLTTVEGTVNVSGADKTTIFNKVNSWATLLGDIAEKDQDNGVIRVNGKMQSSSAYNPFAGSFTDFVSFSLEVKIVGNTVSYSFQDLKLTKVYTGYGTNESIYLFTDLIERIVNVDAKIEKAKEGPKKGRKKAIKKYKADAKSFAQSLEKVKKLLTKKIETLN